MPHQTLVQTSRFDPGLIDPIVSTEALDSLEPLSLSPRLEEPHSRPPQNTPLFTRRMEGSRLRQVMLTSLPLIVADQLSLVVSYSMSAGVVSYATGRLFPHTFVNNLLGLCTAHLAIGLFHQIYPATGTNPVAELRRQLTSMGMACLMLLVLNSVFGVVSPMEIATLGVTVVLIALVAPILRFQTRHLCAGQRWWGESAIIVGTGAQELAVLRHLENLPQRGLKPIGVVDNVPASYWQNTSRNETARFLGEARDLVAICRRHDCHWVMMFAGDNSAERVLTVLEQSTFVPNVIMLYTNLMIPSLWTSTFEAAGLAGVHIRDRLLQPYQRFAKRIFDFVGALILTGLLIVPLLLIGMMVRLASPGPLLYSHERIGRNNRRFRALKIRTMVQNSDEVLREFLASHPAAMEEWRATQKLKDDPRVIPGIGHFLRRTSLDELPQLWNVLKGDMSLVGPRPIYDPNEVSKFGASFPLYLKVRPGLTGLWQVSGRNNTTYNSRVRLDVYYVRNWSMWLDYFVLLRTVRTVLRREGSY